jgi:hypothetical protein
MAPSNGKSQQDATLLDVLIDGFEKNEVWSGFHVRVLPMPDEASAKARFLALAEEGTRWKGPALRREDAGPRRIVGWPDLEIRQFSGGIMLRVLAPRFDWWHDAATWVNDPIGPLYEWLDDDREASQQGEPAQPNVDRRKGPP